MEGAIEMDEVRLYTMATVVDASKFMQEWESRTVLQDRPDLGYEETGGFEQSADMSTGKQKIVELLVNQVECADIVVLNKCDAIAADRLTALEQVIRSLNPNAAAVIRAEFGNVEPSKLLRKIEEDVPTVADNLDDDDHRAALRHARATAAKLKREREHAAAVQQEDGGADRAVREPDRGVP
eukprot:SAG31_NODE_2636_length_5337_cov_11.000955_1_plen_181_part_10